MMDVSNFSRTSCQSRQHRRRWSSCISSMAFLGMWIGVGGTRQTMPVDDSEYNFMILDPEHPYGSPYGGFSRSSASRLASLPLKLPNVVESQDDFEPFFMKVMDAFGKPFLCRAYHEDELDPSTLADGMFEPPVLRKSNPEEEAESFDRSGGVTSTSPSATDESSSHELNDVALREKAKESLSVFKDVCAQYHQSWWSYEWCFEGKITQFHIRIEIDTGNNKVYTIEDVTGLGKFNGKSVTEVSNPNTNTEQSEQAPPRRDVEERAFFDEGDICPETGLPRQAEAVLLCCPSVKSSRKRNTVFRDGKPFETDLLYLKSVQEEQVCTYTLTLCTPLLCHDELLQERQKTLPTASGMAGRKEIENVEDLSVSEVINLVFQGDRKSKCVIFSDGGWWSYELCSGQEIRQYHEVALMDRLTGASRKAVDTVHVLGKYDAASKVSKEDEYHQIVNATMLHTGKSNNAKARSVAPRAHGGNGAYFYLEYPNGDVCDHEDVTDSAIKAGEIGEGRVERSTTVRYGCGGSIGLNVKEDSTCHYVADVTIPALCQHPFFRAPVSKKQVVKCIPEVP